MGEAAVISSLTQLSGKCLSTISLILACWFCRMSGAKNKMTYNMEAWVARAVLRCSGKGYAEIWCKNNHKWRFIIKKLINFEKALCQMNLCQHAHTKTNKHHIWGHTWLYTSSDRRRPISISTNESGTEMRLETKKERQTELKNADHAAAIQCHRRS